MTSVPAIQGIVVTYPDRRGCPPEVLCDPSLCSFMASDWHPMLGPRKEVGLKLLRLDPPGIASLLRGRSGRKWYLITLVPPAREDDVWQPNKWRVHYMQRKYPLVDCRAPHALRPVDWSIKRAAADIVSTWMVGFGKDVHLSHGSWLIRPGTEVASVAHSSILYASSVVFRRTVMHHVRAYHANMLGVTFSDAELRYCEFDGASLESSLTEMQVDSSSFKYCDMRGSNIDIHATDCTFEYARADHAMLNGCVFERCQMHGSVFVGAGLEPGHLQDTSPRGVRIGSGERWPVEGYAVSRDGYVMQAR